MQQLSLFDFDDEQSKMPKAKPESKKQKLNNAKADSPSDSRPENSLFSNAETEKTDVKDQAETIQEEPFNNTPATTETQTDISEERDEFVSATTTIPENENNTAITEENFDAEKTHSTPETIAISTYQKEVPTGIALKKPVSLPVEEKTTQINEAAKVDKKTGEQINDALYFETEQIGIKIKLKEPIPSNKKGAIEEKESGSPEIISTREEKIFTIKKRGRKSFKEIDAEVDLISVPTDEELFKKQYYPISTVAKWFRVNNSLLRYWENQFKILKPKKNKKGDRFFRPEDVKNLQVIYYLLRQKKLTIKGAVNHLKAHRENTEVNLQIIQSLNHFRNFLLELKTNAS